MPAHIDAIPEEPLSHAKFYYMRMDGDYVLYSAGANARDEGTTHDDIVVHRPPDVQRRELIQRLQGNPRFGREVQGRL